MLIFSGWIIIQVLFLLCVVVDVKVVWIGIVEQVEDLVVGIDVVDQYVQFFQVGCELVVIMGVLVEEEDEDILQELWLMVKMICELKKKIEEKFRELQEVMRLFDLGVKEVCVFELQKEL